MLKACLLPLWAPVVLWDYADVKLGSYESVVRPALRSTHCFGDENVTAVTLADGDVVTVLNTGASILSCTYQPAGRWCW